jgi:hypothetical protein
MKSVRSLLLAALLLAAGSSQAITSTSPEKILLIPYAPDMHLSPADVDISIASGMDLGEIRERFRIRLIRDLNAAVAGTQQLEILSGDHVANDDGDVQNIYKALYYQQDTIWPVKFAGLDSLLKKKVSYTVKNKLRPFEKTYMNIGFHDQRLLGELAETYQADVFLFLNEFEIKDHVKDCVDLEGRIHDRELLVHYSVFDRQGRQLHGDVASAHFWSDKNDVEEIMQLTYPAITSYILGSLPAHGGTLNR